MRSVATAKINCPTPDHATSVWHRKIKLTGTRGVATGGGYIGIYTLPNSVTDQLFCALIAADVVRLLVYRTVVSCSKKIIPTLNEFLATPLTGTYLRQYPIQQTKHS